MLPWFVAIVWRVSDEFFALAVGAGSASARWRSGQESHGAPPGYYLLLFWLTFWPAATLAGWRRRRSGRRAASRARKFLLAWIVPAWIVFELVPTKLPHYVLPLYPAIAILIAGVWSIRTRCRARPLAGSMA